MTHRPARINPDTLPVLIVAAVLTLGLAGTSFALTFAALLDVAAWANVTPQLAWAVPVMLDAAIVVYTLAVLVHRARHESAATAWLPLAGFTAVSVVANAAHAGAVPAAWQAVIGTLVAGLAPVAVLLATHTLARLIVAPPAPATDDADDALDRWSRDPLLFTTDPDAVTRLVDRRPPRHTDPRNQARELRAQGLTVREVAKRIGRSPSTVHHWTREATA